MRVRKMAMRTAAILVVLLVGAGLVGCTTWPIRAALDPTPSVAPQAGTDLAPCLDQLSYPNLPVWDLNASLPIEGVAIEYIQSELGMSRGDDCSATPGIRAFPRECPVWSAPSEVTIDAMLGSTPDEVTTTEFARGSTAAITETVTGHTTDGGGFQYRMSSWQYPSAEAAAGSLIPELVAACTGAVHETVDGVDRVAVYDGAEPYLIAFVSGATSYLIESIRNVTPDGTAARIRDTPTGLLPATAMKAIQEWWTSYGTTVLPSPEGVGAANA